MTLQAAWGVPMVQNLAHAGKISASYSVMLIAIGFMTAALLSGLLTAKMGEFKFAKISLGMNMILMFSLLTASMWPFWCYPLWFFLSDSLLLVTCPYGIGVRK